MKLLLDTQIFIWWDSEPERLPARLRAICENPANTLVLSVASVWEMQIKSQLGKLELSRTLSSIITEHQEDNVLEILPIELPHVLALDQLPLHHRDPFDRVIMAQSIAENLVILSVDAMFGQYPVTLYGA
jgi:PIN domain nuclease of toxin-antitoxin system